MSGFREYARSKLIDEIHDALVRGETLFSTESGYVVEVEWKPTTRPGERVAKLTFMRLKEET